MAEEEEEIEVPDNEKIIVVLDNACLEVGKTKGLLTFFFYLIDS